MNLPEPEQVVVARGVDVEPLLRTARAEIAQLSLQLRAVRHEADELEAALTEDDTSARDLLRTSLDELLESRRQELEQTLEQEYVRGAAVIAAARTEAARARLETPLEARPAEPSAEEPIPPPHLRVVGDALDDVAAVSSEAAEGSDVVTDTEAEHEPEALSIDAPLASAQMLDALPPATDEPQPPPSDGDPEVQATDGPHVFESRSAAADPVAHRFDVPPDPALVRELVSAAVTAAVAEAVSATRGGPWASTSWQHEPTGVHHTVVAEPRRLRPFWRKLLHVDVLLPLVLVVIVFVVLLAWVG